MARLVLAHVVDGVVNQDFLHLPAPYKQWDTGRDYAQTITLTLAEMLRRPFLPKSWPSACGNIDKGWFYMQAGLLEHVPICPACTGLELAAAA